MDLVLSTGPRGRAAQIQRSTHGAADDRRKVPQTPADGIGRKRGRQRRRLTLSAPIDGLDGAFLEQRPEFDWHPGLMIEGATIQVPFLADLVSMADPTSPFSYLNFLKQRGRIDRRESVTGADDFIRAVAGFNRTEPTNVAGRSPAHRRPARPGCPPAPASTHRSDTSAPTNTGAIAASPN